MPGFYSIIAQYYDSEHHDKDEDLDLYGELVAEHGAPALIIGAGTGRIMIDLAARGHAVTGIEVDEAMLDRARRKHASAPPAVQKRLTFVHGDALKVVLDGQFRTVIIPYNTLMHFHSLEAHLGVLKRSRAWLADGGALVIDLPNAGESFAAQDTGAVMLERMFLEQETGHLIMQHSVAELDRVTQMMHVTWIYDEVTADQTVKRTLAPVVNRYFFYPELRLLLERAGFTNIEAYGDYDESEFSDGCPRMIVVAK
ncbi:MAG: class I SAM-dependent methyltransferase [Chloroflexota bacterium]|nr:class I SAM-dependent methyltransferase [Chloroflexota bacterium]